MIGFRTGIVDNTIQRSIRIADLSRDNIKFYSNSRSSLSRDNIKVYSDSRSSLSRDNIRVYSNFRTSLSRDNIKAYSNSRSRLSCDNKQGRGYETGGARGAATPGQQSEGSCKINCLHRKIYFLRLANFNLLPKLR